MTSSGTFTSVKPVPNADAGSASAKRTLDNLVLVVPHKHGSVWLIDVLTDERLLPALRMRRARDVEPRTSGPWTYRWPEDTRLAQGELAYTRLLTPDQLDRADVISPHCRAVYVFRDPRDTVVSHYFSLRFSHGLMGKIAEIRDTLRGLSFSDGVLHTIGLQVQMKRYATQALWQACADPRVCRVRYEDLLLRPQDTFGQVCAHFGADVPDRLLDEVIKDHGFERTPGRKLGQVDIFAHKRHGLPGQWKQYLDSRAVETLRREAGRLIEQLGYEPFAAQQEPAPTNDVVVNWSSALEDVVRRINEALSLFPTERVLLYGAGLDLRAVCASTLLYGRSNVLGAIDDNPGLQGTVIGGHCRVFSPAEVEALRPEVIIINSTNHRKELYQRARKMAAGLPFRVDVFY